MSEDDAFEVIEFAGSVLTVKHRQTAIFFSFDVRTRPSGYYLNEGVVHTGDPRTAERIEARRFAESYLRDLRPSDVPGTR